MEGEEKKESERSKIAKWHLDLIKVRSVQRMHAMTGSWPCGT